MEKASDGSLTGAPEKRPRRKDDDEEEERETALSRYKPWVSNLAHRAVGLPDANHVRRLTYSGGKNIIYLPDAIERSDLLNYLPFSSSPRFSWNAALMSAMWVKACGKLPKCSPEGPSSSG